ncbi:MAG: SurA N-terminal domain-containing protein [Congregibacter sp.]
MLQDIRANTQGTAAKIIIGLIVVSFSIFGIESLLFSGGPSGIAEVNGKEITEFELQQELSVQQRRLLAMLGEDADPALLDDVVLRQQALESLLQREVIEQAAADFDLSTADEAIANVIGAMEQFQIDGQFSVDMFQSALAQAGFTPSLFRERLADDMRIGQLRAGIAGSDFATSEELELSALIGFEGRDVRYISLPLVDFLADANPSDEAISAYYAENQEQFYTEEGVVLEYIELNRDDYREPVSEERLREEFELVRDQYELATETRVSHILIEGDDADREARVAEVLAALEGGMSFEDAAREYSDDIGSAQGGGDLGYTSGDTFPEPMEEAIAALAAGERSGPVETEAGTHLILATDRREGSEVAFEDVAREIEEELQRGEAAAVLLRNVEELRDLAFNAPDLDDPAAALELEVRRTDAIRRGDDDPLFGRPLVQQAIFSDDVLEAGHNSEVLEISPERFLLLRVAERMSPELQPLDVVRVDIEARLRDQMALEASEAKAAELLTALESGESVESLANTAGLEWQVELGARRDSRRVPAAVLEKLFAMPEPSDGEPKRAIVSSGSDASYVMEFVRVTRGELASVSDAEATQLRSRVAGELGGLTQQQLESSLREKAEIVVY